MKFADLQVDDNLQIPNFEAKEQEDDDSIGFIGFSFRLVSQRSWKIKLAPIVELLKAALEVLPSSRTKPKVLRKSLNGKRRPKWPSAVGKKRNFLFKVLQQLQPSIKIVYDYGQDLISY